jgi:hypothetical protein
MKDIQKFQHERNWPIKLQNQLQLALLRLVQHLKVEKIFLDYTTVPTVIYSNLPAQADTTANDATRPSKAPNTNDLGEKIKCYEGYLIS